MGGNPKKPRVLILVLSVTYCRSLGKSLLCFSLFIYEMEGLVGQVSKVRDSSGVFRLRMGFPGHSTPSPRVSAGRDA